MSTAFRVGLFTIFTVLGIFAVWYVLGNVSLRKGSYQMAVHFRNVVGLQPGSSVELAGVDIGIVDEIKLLPDQTASVYCSIHREHTIYRGSIFTITQTLTGAQSTLTIIPPADLATAVPLPKRVLPEAQQPEGTVPPTIADLVNEGQKRLLELDRTLALVNRELPGIVRNFNGVATHTNSLIVHADKNFNLLGQQLNTTIGTVNAIAGQLTGLLAVNGQNISVMTTSMRQLIAASGPKLAALIDNLSATAANLNKTMASVQAIAADPRLKANLVATTANLAESSEKLKAIASDIQQVTGDPKVKAELRSTVQNLDDAIAKANDILGNFSTAEGGEVPAAESSSGQPVPSASSSPASAPYSHSHGGAAFRMGHPPNPYELVNGSVRLNWTSLPSGPNSDVEVTLFPHFPRNLTLGAQGLGQNSTYEFLANLRGSPNLQYSVGVLYSQLGLKTVWTGLGPLGVDLRLYNSSWPRLDLYGDLRLTRRLMFFYGEKSLVGPSSTRVWQGGLQFGP